MHIPSVRIAGPTRRPAEAGFSVVEVLVAGSVIALAALALASSVLSGHQLARTEESRGVALGTARAFLDRLRADEDWDGLYGRLWVQVDVAKVPTQTTWPVEAYYSDFQTPPALGRVRVRVDVPHDVDHGLARFWVRSRYSMP